MIQQRTTVPQPSRQTTQVQQQAQITQQSHVHQQVQHQTTLQLPLQQVMFPVCLLNYIICEKLRILIPPLLKMLMPIFIVHFSKCLTHGVFLLKTPCVIYKLMGISCLSSLYHMYHVNLFSQI